MGAPLIVLGAIAAVGEVGKMYEESEASRARIEQLNMQQKQNTIQSQQKSLQNGDIMNRVLDRQTAEATGKGVALSSASFNAIQRNTLNVGAKEQTNIDTQQSLQEYNTDVEKDNTKRTLFAQLFGDVAGAGMSFAGMKAATPSMSDTPAYWKLPGEEHPA